MRDCNTKTTPQSMTYNPIKMWLRIDYLKSSIK